jgi:predicted esterase
MVSSPRKVRGWWALSVFVAALVPQAIVAQPSGSTATETGVSSRAALAAAYLRIERAYATTTMSDSVRAAVNRQVDRAALSFFAGRFASAIAAVDSATVRVTGAPITPVAPATPRSVNGRLPSTLRSMLLSRLGRIDSTGPLAQPWAAARARAELLVDVPSPERSAEFLADPERLSRDLAREVSVLERGRNPYVGQAGDFWRVFRGANGAAIPIRVVAPNAAAVSSAPVPLIVALHGAGGDENMFIDGYGNGVLAQLAMAANAIVVTPATVPFAQSPASFDSLLAVLRREYRIHDARIYLLGHSAGAGAATTLAGQRRTMLTAVAALAGGAAMGKDAAGAAPVPALYIAAELDPLAPPRRIEAAATATLGAEFRVLAHEGHLLMVGNGVRAALPWLLAHRP